MKNKLVPEIGDYVQVKYAVIDFDEENIGKYFKVKAIKCFIRDSSGVHADIHIEHNYRKDWYLTLSQVEVVPKEIYESPLFQAMQELGT